MGIASGVLAFAAAGEMALMRFALVLLLCATVFAEHEHKDFAELGAEALTPGQDLGADALLDIGAKVGAAVQDSAKAKVMDYDHALKKKDHAQLEYATFRSATGGTLQYDKAAHYVRHMGDSAEVTTASSEADKRDIVWKIRSPLCVPGSGSCPKNLKGYYLRHKGTRMHLEKPRGNTLAQATFCMRPGLSDRRAISFEALSKPKFFVRHNGYHLYICDNTNEGGCGRTSLDAFRKDATFHKKDPEFFGTCEGPMKPQKCTCARGRTGPKCMVQCPGLLDGGKVSCSGRGSCLFDKKKQTASCRCKFGSVGKDCAQACPKGLSQQVCSKNGKCSGDKLGRAKCKCMGPWRGKACDAKCPGSSKSKVCFGHGKCLYDEVKKVTFCKCTKGYLGNQCKVTCPKDSKGRICFGQGKCVPGGAGGGKCLCKEGFKGSDCAMKCRKDALGRICGGKKRGECVKHSSQGKTVCKCKKGFLGKDCGVTCPRLGEGDVCSGKGTCLMDSKTKKAKCVCKKGHTGDKCHQPCPANKNGDVCNGHGKCFADAKGKKAKCKCTGGFIGSACAHNCPGSGSSKGKVACSGHGTCSIGKSKGKQGASCKCKAGHLGKGCNLVCPQHKKVTCGGQGSCFLKNGAPKCKCKQGFMGSSCQYECPGRTAKTSCSGKGKCTLVGGKKGKGFKTKCLCKKGYGGRTCEQSCPFKKATSGKSKGKTVPCFGKGDCVANKTGMKCMCKKGWLGKDCSAPCPTSKNGEICSRRGLCTMSTKKKPKCDCKDGYIGRSCSATCPRSAGKICTGHGKCISGKGGTAACKCHKDYAGATCSEGCPKDKNGTICNGNGKCQLKNNKAICKCNAGRTGKDCEHRVCSTANSLFDKKTSRCLCEPGYTCCSRKKLQMIMAKEETDDLSEFNV